MNTTGRRPDPPESEPAVPPSLRVLPCVGCWGLGVGLPGPVDFLGKPLPCVRHLPANLVRVRAGPSAVKPLEAAQTLSTSPTGALDDPTKQHPDSRPAGTSG